MDNFIKIIEDYKKRCITEAVPPPPPGGAGAEGMPPPAPGGEGGAPPAPQGGGISDVDASQKVVATLSKKIDDIYQQSGKPYLDLASVLVSVIQDGFNDEDRAKLDSMLPKNITLEDLRKTDTKGITDKVKVSALQAASITIFDMVNKIMGGHNPVDQDNFRDEYDV